MARKFVLTNEQKTVVIKAIDSAVRATGTGGWMKDIMPAVKALDIVPEGGWMEVRNCLQHLMNVRKIARAPFDPKADDEYYVAKAGV